MSDNTRIGWTQATWNPVTGCSPISAGCQHCYAAVMARRLKAMEQANYRRGFQVAYHPAMLPIPLKWRKPRMIFVCSMGDLFHADVPDKVIHEIFTVMVQAKQHTFQVLTKRAERLAAMASGLPWPKNIWAGVTVENADYIHRIDLLRTVPATVRFLSLEPLIGPIPNINLDFIDWAIVGGESGPKSRPMDPAWARDVRDRCIAAKVPFFFKQHGGVHKKKAGRILDGRTWDEMPVGVAGSK